MVKGTNAGSRVTKAASASKKRARETEGANGQRKRSRATKAGTSKKKRTTEVTNRRRRRGAAPRTEQEEPSPSSTDQEQRPQTARSEAQDVSTNTKPLEAFVIMPSGANDEYDEGVREADFVYTHIICSGMEQVQERLGRSIVVTREVDNRTTGSITADIVRRTASADIAITDITGMNPNVFFELGMRYGIRRSTTVLLRKANLSHPIRYHSLSGDFI